MKSGFTIIELMIALLISSLVAISLYQLYFKTSRIVKEIIQVINMDEPIYPIYNRLQNDITGMFAPRATINSYLKKLAEKKDKEEKKEDKPSIKSEQKVEQSKPEEKQDEEKKHDNTVKNVFYIETKEKGYLFLSFITTGGISHLEANGSTAPQSFMRRVAYVIEDNPSRPGTLTLSYRFSNDNLELDFIKKPAFYPSYKILSGIKDFAIEFTIFELSDKNEKDKKSSKIVLKEWKEDEIFEKYKALMPAYITIKGSYTDEVGKVIHPFEFDFKVYSYSNYELPVKPVMKQPAPEKAKSDKPENAMNKISKFFDETFNNKNGNSTKNITTGEISAKK